MTFLLIPFRPPAAGGLDGPCEHTLMSTEKYHSFLHKLFGTKLSLPLKHITGTALASQTRRWQAPRSEQQESSTELGVPPPHGDARPHGTGAAPNSFECHGALARFW